MRLQNTGYHRCKSSRYTESQWRSVRLRHRLLDVCQSLAVWNRRISYRTFLILAVSVRLHRGRFIWGALTCSVLWLYTIAVMLFPETHYWLVTLSVARGDQIGEGDKDSGHHRPATQTSLEHTDVLSYWPKKRRAARNSSWRWRLQLRLWWENEKV